MYKGGLNVDISTLNHVSECVWEIPQAGDMRVPGKIFADKHLVESMDEMVREQTSNVACLPGIQVASMAMPDAHWGYGFPIGGVAAFDPEEDGVVSVGGVGFDINCGINVLKTDVTRAEVEAKREVLAENLYNRVPAGLGSTGEIRLSIDELEKVLIGGAEWAVEKGYGRKEDLQYIEENGKMDHVDPRNVSYRAKKRQLEQVGTLGSGNHYLEVQYINKIFDDESAKIFGVKKDDVVVSIHCGSRGLGHQIGMDYLKVLDVASRKYGIPIRERELVAAPIKSDEGKQYFSAVCCGINLAFANRQVIGHLVRGVFDKLFPNSVLDVLYHIGHNTCKIEKHNVEGKTKELYVHRKGSTRCFGPDREEVPLVYRSAGQPAFIGGTMGTSSFILVGTKYGTEHAFGSTCHGAGRNMSRKKAKKLFYGTRVIQELHDRGIIVKGHSNIGIAEEAPGAYKDVVKVVQSVEKAGIAKIVAQAKPMLCIKG